MAGIILLTALSFLSGVFMILGAILLLRSDKKAVPLMLVSFGCFMLTLIAGLWATTFGAPWELSADQKWMLISLGPGVSLLAFLVTIVIGLFGDLPMQKAPVWAKAVGILYSVSLLILVGTALYPEWLDKVYGWQGYSAFVRGPRGTAMFRGAMAVILTVMFYNRVHGKRKHAQ